MTVILVGLLSGAVVLLGVAVSVEALVWAEEPGRIVPGWWRR